MMTLFEKRKEHARKPGSDLIFHEANIRVRSCLVRSSLSHAEPRFEEAEGRSFMMHSGWIFSWGTMKDLAPVPMLGI